MMEQVHPVLLDGSLHWRRAMSELGCDNEAWARVRERSDIVCFKTGPLRSPAASILKQCMLAAGADALVHRLVLTCCIERSSALVYGTPKCLRAGCESLNGQPFGLPELGRELFALLCVPDAPDTIVLGGRTLSFGFRPVFMGVLNCTPDSFSDGGLWAEPSKAVEHGIAMHEQGAAVIDVGGESTRPGSMPTPPGQQIERVLPVIEGLAGSSGAVISIDTTEPEVARAAIAAGALIINSINGMKTPGMAELAAETGVAAILMHMRGVPASMQNDPEYSDAVSEVAIRLLGDVNRVADAGVARNMILVDPGIGFGKRPWDNLNLIGATPWLRRTTGCRVVLGHSRKSFLGLLSGENEPAARDRATALVSALSIGKADLLRVHNVKECVRAVDAVLDGMGP